MSFCFEKRLREKSRGGTELLVDIVRPVSVEVEVAVVPVEVGRVHELTIAVGILLLPVHYHQELKFTV
jgi:hypothetical protein